MNFSYINISFCVHLYRVNEFYFLYDTVYFCNDYCMLVLTSFFENHNEKRNKMTIVDFFINKNYCLYMYVSHDEMILFTNFLFSPYLHLSQSLAYLPHSVLKLANVCKKSTE